MDPGFVAAPWDLHLAPGSPCIDRGLQALPSVDDGGTPEHDFDGEPRPGVPDVGADEFSAADHSCGGGNCSGLGLCRRSPDGDECLCSPAAQHPDGDQLACEIDPCLVDNGGC